MAMIDIVGIVGFVGQWFGLGNSKLTRPFNRILHFTTFVFACVETNQRNRGTGPAVVYVAATQYQQHPQYYPQHPQYDQNPGGMYQQAPPQHAYQQPQMPQQAYQQPEVKA